MVYLGWCLRSESIQTSKQLYKYLLRECNKLPPETHNYYRHFLRQGFTQHSDESDPERVRQIINRAIEDATWLVKKYSKSQ
ncbi:hypothetical protein Pmani_033251 [Petrolisthes manimaculis]|uniref:LYR motif-containing protein 9 n=1 Tax=Petrolisthes manimaculis TaxID=1843537 RepID=A0AAE1NRA9_9EUCA|nr:hypothetical protein Pmani_033251 [Petrolisthes manimaculis]